MNTDNLFQDIIAECLYLAHEFECEGDLSRAREFFELGGWYIKQGLLDTPMEV